MKKFNSFKERVKKNFKENKVLLFAFIVIWVVAIIFTNNHYKATIGKTSFGNDIYDRSVVELNKNTIVETIIPIEDKTESVSILFATYARNNSGSINIKVIGDKSNKQYVNEDIDVNSVQDNAYLTVPLSEISNKNVDDNFRIIVTSNSEEGKGIGLYYSNINYYDNSSLKINNEIVENADLCVRFLTSDELLESFSNTLIISLVTCITLLALVYLLINPKIEVMFALTALVFGIFMMIVIVPASPPDELSHYEVALQLSNSILGKDVKTIDSSYLKYGYMYGHYNISAGYVRFVNDIFGPLKLTGKVETLSRDVFDLYWIQYIPNALGITLGRLLNCNMITTFYFGRLMNLIAYVVCIYFAIKNTPSFKNIFGMIAILPMFLQTAASITYDGFILGLSFLIISFFTKFYFEDKKIKIVDLIIVIIMCNLLAPAKVVYGFFAFLFIFIPSTKYGGKWKKIGAIVLICASSIYQLYDIMSGPLQLLLNNVLKVQKNNEIVLDSTNNVISTNANIPVIPKESEGFSFSYMFKHPIETIQIFYRTIRYRIKFWFYGSLGRALSGDTLIIPLGLVYSLIGVVAVSSFTKQTYTFKWLIKLLLVGICMIIGLYVMVGMFVSWTQSTQIIVEDYGGLLVEGIQGRYFCPLLPYFFLVLPNKKVSLPEKINKYTLLIYFIVFFEIIMYVLSYTFVN